MAEGARVSVRLKVSPEVARIVRDAPREMQVSAARGTLPLSGEDLLTTLFFLIHGRDPQLRSLAMETLRSVPSGVFVPVVRNPATHPHLLDLVAQVRLTDLPLMEIVLTHPAVSTETLVRVAARAEGAVLSLVACNDGRLSSAPEIAEAIVSNPRADRVLKFRFGWKEPQAEPPAAVEPAVREDAEEETEPLEDGEGDEPAEGEEEINLSKYKMALQMDVAQKIKFALTGDKEWRTIFLKDTNKLVSSAVLKNPRITDGEVLGVAKNKSAHDELVRLITLNQEWVKNYEIQKALVYHPRTPLPKALRYMNVLSPKDLKSLAKSRGVSQVLVNNARRMLMAKEKSK